MALVVTVTGPNGLQISISAAYTHNKNLCKSF